MLHGCQAMLPAGAGLEALLSIGRDYKFAPLTG